MTGIGNNFGPKSAMGMKNAQNLQNLQKTDKSGLVGEPKEATAAERPQGNTGTEDRVIKHGTGNLYDGFSVDGGLDPDAVNVVVLVDKDGTITIATIWTDENGTIEDMWVDGHSYDPDSNRT